MSKHTAAAISERRQKLWTMLTRRLKTNKIDKEINTDHSTVSRDIKYLTTQSQNYLNDSKWTLPLCTKLVSKEYMKSEKNTGAYR